jgi:hypothetical protein
MLIIFVFVHFSTFFCSFFTDFYFFIFCSVYPIFSSFFTDFCSIFLFTLSFFTDFKFFDSFVKYGREKQKKNVRFSPKKHSFVFCSFLTDFFSFCCPKTLKKA